MYMKVFAHGTGRGELATDYLVRTDYHNREDEPPKVLRGDPNLTADLINSIDRKWKYTAGVLSWHPDDKISPEQEKELMEDFEKLAFAGLEADQYNILWVRHTHANHHELHFVIPRMELATGKAFNPCPPNWQKHFDPLRDLYNIKENWARPDDPERKRLFTPPQADIKYNRLKRWGVDIIKSEIDEIRELLIDYTVKRIESGLIQNRDDIIQSFQELGLQINRKGKDYITVHDTENNKKIRLKGGVFHEDWRLRKENSSEITGRYQKDGASRTSELTRLRDELKTIHTKRSEYNRERYKQTQKSHTHTHEREFKNLSLQLLPDNLPFIRADSRDILSEQRNELLHDTQNQQSTIADRNLGTRKETASTYFEETRDIGNKTRNEQERKLSDSSLWSKSQHRLERGQTERNQVGEYKGLNSPKLHNLELNNTKLENTEINNIELENAKLESTKLENTELGSTKLENIESNNIELNNANFYRKEQTHERNTRIPTGNIQQDRAEFQQQIRYPRQSNKELANSSERIANPSEGIGNATKQLGAILDGLNYLLQQITKLIPNLTRKIEQIRAKDTRFFEREKPIDKGMSR